jgi:UDP-N-acetylglucosamine 1-carboxyvinyltransferase
MPDYNPSIIRPPSADSSKFVINGGKTLRGEIEVRGAKNAAFPILAATLLTKEECIIENLPLIEDVFRMLEILESMGVEVSWLGERTVRIKAKSLDPTKIKESLVLLLRGSVLLFGSLLARFNEAKLPQPGGCIIGARPIDTHLDGFRQLGVKITPVRNCYFKLELNQKPKNPYVILKEFSVTATENLLLFSALNPAKTTIKIADTDYQVQELIRFLNKMGVKIEGTGAHNLIIKGAKKLRGVRHRLIYDPIEAGTFILAAGAGKSDVLVKNVELPFLEFSLKKLKDSGLPYKIFKQNKNLASIRLFSWKVLKLDKVQSLPYPGIPSDLLTSFGVLATQGTSPTLIHDPLYEGRLKYLEELTKMGAEIIFADSHRAIINGPTKLYGQELGSFDLRGGAALIIAGLIAKGRTTISNIYQVDRGYEKIEERLQSLGADIKRIKE